MVQIWHLDDYMYGDPRLPHYVYPPKKLSPDDLFKRTSVKYVKVIKKLSLKTLSN